MLRPLNGTAEMFPGRLDAGFNQVLGAMDKEKLLGVRLIGDNAGFLRAGVKHMNVFDGIRPAGPPRGLVNQEVTVFKKLHHRLVVSGVPSQT